MISFLLHPPRRPLRRMQGRLAQEMWTSLLQNEVQFASRLEDTEHVLPELTFVASDTPSTSSNFWMIPKCPCRVFVCVCVCVCVCVRARARVRSRASVQSFASPTAWHHIAMLR